MKIALITDTHFGARGDSSAFDLSFKRFYSEVFFPTLIDRNIKQIIHLGDCFDRRKYINFNSLKTCREYFFDKAKELGIKIDMLVGNHDTFFKNTNEVNSPDLLLNDYENITTISNPLVREYGDLKILMLPWICNDNYDKVMEYVNAKEASVCFGHLELNGFQMWKGQESFEGHDPKIFKDYRLVYSGHFHHKHGKDNIHYLGNPYQMFWNDYEDERGFHIFDTEKLESEFIINPFTMFEKLYYDDSKELPDVNSFKDKMIKVVVVNKTNIYDYDRYIDNLYKANPIEVRIIEDYSEFEGEAVGDESLDVSDTLTLLEQYVDAIDTDADKNRLKTLMKTLYVEAQDFATE